MCFLVLSLPCLYCMYLRFESSQLGCLGGSIGREHSTSNPVVTGFKSHLRQLGVFFHCLPSDFALIALSSLHILYMYITRFDCVRFLFHRIYMYMYMCTSQDLIPFLPSRLLCTYCCVSLSTSSLYKKIDIDRVLC